MFKNMAFLIKPVKDEPRQLNSEPRTWDIDLDVDSAIHETLKTAENITETIVCGAVVLTVVYVASDTVRKSALHILKRIIK